MKVFTVGMDEKSPTKEPLPSPDGVSMASTPVITFEKKRSSYKSYLMCLLTLFFVLVLAIVISELAYSRARDESYLRLRWAELKHRMGFGCDECAAASRVVHNFYPQRIPGPPMIVGTYNSREDEPAVPAALNQEQASAVSTTETVATTKSLPFSGDSRLDFLRKIIPKIKEEAEKSGIDGVMQVKVMQVDPAVQSSSFMDGFGEVQQPLDNQNDFNGMRPLLGPLNDFLRWTLGDPDNSRPVMPPPYSQQSDVIMPEAMPLSSGAMQIWPVAWEPDMRGWSLQQAQPWLEAYPRPQWLRPGPWQWPANFQRAQQQPSGPPPPPTLYQANNNAPQAPQGPEMNWQNGVQNSNFWPQNDNSINGQWQNGIQNAIRGKVESQRPWNWNYPMLNKWSQEMNVKPWQWWGPRIHSSQVQENGPWQQQSANNDLALQKVNIADNLDGRMAQAIVPNADGNSQWMKYYSQWYANNQQLQQQQPIATAAVSQSLEIAAPRAQQEQQQVQVQVPEPRFVFPEQQQQMPVPEQRLQEQQQQEQQQQASFEHSVFPEQPIVPEVNTAQIPEAAGAQNPVVPVEQSVNNDPQASVPSFVFNNDAWQKPVAPAFEQAGAQQRQQQQSFEENEQPNNAPLPQIIDDGALKDTSMETAFQQAPMNDAKLAMASPIFFQVDEPPQMAN